MEETIERLFKEAKEKDEFEFVCTLINYKGLGTRLNTSNLIEWFDSISHYAELYEEEADKTKKTRYGLMLYSTFFESSDFYNILGSLARVVLGYRAVPYLYFKHENADRWLGTGEKISLVTEVLADAGFEDICSFFETNHHKQLRNTFFHSAYSIEENDYTLHDSDSIIIDNVGYPMVEIDPFIFDRVNAVILFHRKFKGEFQNHFSSYKEEKTIVGRFPEEQEIVVIGSENGLRGFKAGGSYILLQDDDMWMGMNIRFNTPSAVDSFVSDELQRLFKKDSIRTNDGALKHLAEVIIERNKQNEIKDLGIIYMKFAMAFKSSAAEEENPWKKNSIFDFAISFYDIGRNYNSDLPIDYNMSVIKYMRGSNEKNTELTILSIEEMCKCIPENTTETMVTQLEYLINDLRKQGIEEKYYKPHILEALAAIEGDAFEEHIEKIKALF